MKEWLCRRSGGDGKFELISLIQWSNSNACISLQWIKRVKDISSIDNKVTNANGEFNCADHQERSLPFQRMRIKISATENSDIAISIAL